MISEIISMNGLVYTERRECKVEGNLELNKKKILITSFDLAIGGVERSLIGLLNQIDYKKYSVDLMLFKHEGEFLSFLPSGPNLLAEVPYYTTFRKSIPEIMKDGNFLVAINRVIAKYLGEIHARIKNIEESGYLTIQYSWEMTQGLLPKLNKEYDVAIGFLWPHHFIGNKVIARKKIGWIHTDYSNIYVNQKIDSKMWNKLDHIVAVSDECSKTFIDTFPHLKKKTTVIENILSPSFINEQADADKPVGITTAPGSTVLVTVGRLSHAKGLDNAIQCCKKLVDNGHDIKWYVIGYGPLEEQLKQLIIDLKLTENFFLLGKKINPYPYIKACDIYVQPSRYEGKAVTIREAQILGKPVVLTNFPTAKSQAVNGFDALITEQDIDSLTEGIQRLLADGNLKNSLIASVRQTDYGNEEEIEKLYELIEA